MTTLARNFAITSCILLVPCWMLLRCAADFEGAIYLALMSLIQVVHSLVSIVIASYGWAHRRNGCGPILATSAALLLGGALGSPGIAFFVTMARWTR